MRSKRKNFMILSAVLAVSFVLNIALGSDIASVFSVFSSDIFEDIIFKIRLPRALMAVLAGGTFALCGAVFQSLFRNPIASPFTLGTASGASFGVTVLISFIPLTGFLGMSLISLSAFIGSLLSVAIVYAASLRSGKFNPNSMILTGVVINFFFSGLILFIQYLTDQANAVRITLWTMGGLDIVGMNSVLFAFLVFAAGFLIIYRFRDDLNLLFIGEEISVSRGVNIKRSRKYLFVVSSLMISTIVSFTGPIGFIGIIAPHIASNYFGRNYRILLPASLMTGSVILLVCDLISRTVLWPVEIPVGIITALIGAAFFVRIISK
ncbi:MAG TPA: iron ABC transporter permease [Clostridiales bacterium]|jgi:iron complex transport system permease protein|nr:iron ABC transporter permease [Clostridiales bacterium]HQP69837.1 iron ABC transporter permease [Clostridiales bacterium]